MATAEERGFLAALKQDPDDRASRLAYADWLEDHGRRYDAVQQRVKAGVSEVRFKVRRKSDGLLSDGYGDWSPTKGREWKRVGDAKAHLTSSTDGPNYFGVPLTEVEIVVFEVRSQVVAVVPILATQQQSYSTAITFGEVTPAGGSPP